ncbi:hypothetical protein [Limihaloglobus sulfuriphilus]|uniref:hypothetical protein n=1 Tax=Limihaloglobus sulfuriphilus TaxID=1851148 RepID=UPI0016499453|nr:hypothetical protein [Limihaloglobus sulfuriphilus]
MESREWKAESRRIEIADLEIISLEEDLKREEKRKRAKYQSVTKIDKIVFFFK